MASDERQAAKPRAARNAGAGERKKKTVFLLLLVFSPNLHSWNAIARANDPEHKRPTARSLWAGGLKASDTDENNLDFLADQFNYIIHFIWDTPGLKINLL